VQPARGAPVERRVAVGVLGVGIGAVLKKILQQWDVTPDRRLQSRPVELREPGDGLVRDSSDCAEDRHFFFLKKKKKNSYVEFVD
jgi:hypothetical protein